MLFRGVKVFRFGLKNYAQSPMLFFIAGDLEQLGLKLVSVSYALNAESELVLQIANNLKNILFNKKLKRNQKKISYPFFLNYFFSLIPEFINTFIEVTIHYRRNICIINTNLF